MPSWTNVGWMPKRGSHQFKADGLCQVKCNRVKCCPSTSTRPRTVVWLSLIRSASLWYGGDPCTHTSIHRNVVVVGHTVLPRPFHINLLYNKNNNKQEHTLQIIVKMRLTLMRISINIILSHLLFVLWRFQLPSLPIQVVELAMMMMVFETSSKSICHKCSDMFDCSKGIICAVTFCGWSVFLSWLLLVAIKPFCSHSKACLHVCVCVCALMSKLVMSFQWKCIITVINVWWHCVRKCNSNSEW